MADDELELYKKYRPRSFKAMVGNSDAVAQVARWVKSKKVPHCILFQGGSGMGKTTLARILKSKLECGEADYQEINAAGQARGIESIKRIEGQMWGAPISGGCRIYLLDEAHNLTSDAQNALLKMLEDTPRHVYFMLCTTTPQKLIKTIRTRASVVTVAPLTADEMRTLLRKVCGKEGVEISEDVEDAIIEASDGSSRQALVTLGQVIGLDDEEQQLGVIKKADTQRQAIELCRKLMNTRASWQEIAAILRDLTDEPEMVRWMMLGYATTVCLGGGKLANRAFVILDQFSGNYFDTKKAGLVADCWEVVHGRKDE